MIQNDWVVTYVDGKEADPEMDYSYMKDEKTVSDHQFGKQCTGKAFNQGKGLRGIFGLGAENIPDWSTDGTFKTLPANSLGTTMMEWIADRNTELYLGGTGYGSEPLGQSYGTIEGVCLDDLAFFDYAMTSKEALDLYEEAQISAFVQQIGDVNGDGFINATDAVAILQHFANISPLTGDAKDSADVNRDGNINATDAVYVLQRFANMLSDEEWSQITKDSAKAE